MRLLFALALLASGGCAPAGCDGPAFAFRTPTGPNHYVAPGDMASGGGGGSVTFVQSKSSHVVSSPSGTAAQTINFNSNVTGGNAVVGLIRCHSNNAGTVTAKYNGAALTLITSQSDHSAYIAAFVRANVTGGATTVTFEGTYAGTGFDYGDVSVAIGEYSGVNAATPVVGYDPQTDGGSYYELVTGSVTTAASGRLLGWGTSTEQKAITAPATGHTLREQAWSAVAYVEQTASTSAGSDAVDIGAVSNSYWAALGIALQP